MFYAFSYTPVNSDPVPAAYKLDLPLTTGVIHQVDVLFQNGCAHKEYVQIWHANHQLWPSNRGEKLRGNATVVSFREFYELIPGHTNLHAMIWTDLTADNAEIIVQIGLLPKRIIQPMSFDELLSAARGY